MALNLDGLELNEEQIAKLNELNSNLIPAEEVEGLKKNRDELLAEKKAVAEAKKLAEEKAEAERLAALEAKNDNKALAESYKEKLEAYEQRERQFKEQQQKQAINSEALTMAKQIATGDNAELLATFIEQRLRADGEEIKVTDASGNLTISTKEDLLNEFKSNKKFASLVTVTKASGGAGGSNGERGSASVAKSKPFSEMTKSEKLEYMGSKIEE